MAATLAAQAPAGKPAAATSAAGTAPTGPLSWKALYFYDEDMSGLMLHDIQYPGPKCLFALGTQSTKGKSKSVALRSVDGGKSWVIAPLKNHGRSAFFLSERLGWIVTEDGLERTSDCGVTLEKLGKQKGLLRVFFRDEALGWAVGAPKKAVSTRDGGKSWTEIKPASDSTAAADRSAYTSIEFAGEKFGVITGFHQPVRHGAQFPVWMDPEAAQLRRQWPSLTLMLQTLDGGATWQGFTASLLGRVSKVRTPPGGNGSGLALVEFDESFDYPSEIYRMGVGQASAARVFRDKEHAITDLTLTADGWTFLAGVQTTGAVRLPVPGKVRIRRSQDQVNWTEDPVDYRAVANRVWVAAGPGGQVVAATDQGMILRLE